MGCIIWFHFGKDFGSCGHNFVAFTCSVKRVVGVEDCGEEAEGESTDAERHVKASVPETLEHLCTEKTKHKVIIYNLYNFFFF